MQQPPLVNDEVVRKQMEEVLEGGITLSGRKFSRAKKLTFEHFNYRVETVKRSGVIEVFRAYHADMDPDEFDIFLALLIGRAAGAGKLYELYACLLIEEGVQWSPELQKTAPAFFSRLDSPEDQLTLMNILLWLLLDFFLNGVVSNPISRKYLWGTAQSTSARRQNAATNTMGPSSQLSLQLPTSEGQRPT